MLGQNNLYILLLTVMVVSAIWAVVSRSLLKAALGLALTSAGLTMIMFLLGSPLSAVFELSVCTGLITAIFVSTISLTKVLTHQQIMDLSKERLKRFGYLPFVAIVAGILVYIFTKNLNVVLPAEETEKNVQNVLWNVRQLDLFGQIIALLAGAFGVVILFKEKKSDE